jgi:hypothetical protein
MTRGDARPDEAEQATQRVMHSSCRLPLALLLVLCQLTSCSEADEIGSGGDSPSAESSARAPNRTLEQPPSEEAIERPEGVDGRFRRVRRPATSDAGMSDEMREEIERLESIGYVSGSLPSRTARGVTVHDTDRAAPGSNFYTSGHAPTALLIDMDGNVLHRWSVRFDEVWPEHEDMGKKEYAHFIRRAHLFENGDILAVWDSIGIAKIDKDSKILWTRANRAHHDLEVLPSGDIYVLTSEIHVVDRLSPAYRVREDFITLLSPDGTERSRVSLLEAFENSDRYRALWQERIRTRGELMHTNTLAVLDDRIADVAPAFSAGRVLTSMLLMDTIAVVDLERREVVWAVADRFRWQHDPKVLPDGTLLLFNNRYREVDEEHAQALSRVEEYDPKTMQLLWSYHGSESTPLYSQMCGAAQRLSNGNTLITESDNGRALEVTPDGEIAWEFHNPEVVGDEGEFVASILELRRLAPDFPTAWTATPSGVTQGSSAPH